MTRASCARIVEQEVQHVVRSRLISIRTARILRFFESVIIVLPFIWVQPAPRHKHVKSSLHGHLVVHTRYTAHCRRGPVVESGICFPRPSVKLPVLPAQCTRDRSVTVRR
jgi:hypothetical protein